MEAMADSRDVELEQSSESNGINWKVRVRNKWFWVTLIPLMALLLQQVLAIFGVALDVEGVTAQLVAVVETVFLILGLLGVAVDMTTQGFGDSDRAMTYLWPKK